MTTFLPQAIADFQSTASALSASRSPSDQTHESLRGGMTFRVFEIVYPSKHLTLTTYTYPDGKLEQYLVDPAE